MALVGVVVGVLAEDELHPLGRGSAWKARSSVRAAGSGWLGRPECCEGMLVVMLIWGACTLREKVEFCGNVFVSFFNSILKLFY